MNTPNLLLKITFLVLNITACNSFMFGQNNLSQLFESALPSIVKVETFDSDNTPLATGTGFFISADGQGISNLHVFRGASKSQITTPNGKTFPINNIRYKNDSLDLVTFSIVKDNDASFTFLNVSKTVPKAGEEVFVIGNPIGLDFSVSNGIISSVRQQEGFGQIIQTSAPISAGNSGSPLINMNGMVIGVITYTFTEGQNLNFAISLVDKNLTDDFKGLNIPKLSESSNNKNKNWVEDEYGNVRGFHYAMCMNWQFNIDFQKNMADMQGFKWAINVEKAGRLVPIESYVQGYYEGDIVGTTSVVVVDKNLAYVISYGTKYDYNSTAKSALILVSRITEGEPYHIFNNYVEKTRIKSNSNKFLEKAGNPKIAVIVEDQMYVRSIFLEDKVQNIPFTGNTFYLNTYVY